jgi:CBF1 interacting corepressor
MVQGMAFLSKKGFNPQNNSNRKRVWEAQQHSKQEKERLRQRQEQLSREQEEQELERVTKGEIGGSQAQLRFMYDAPPGLNKAKGNNRGEETYDDEVGENRKSHSGPCESSTAAAISMDHLTQIKPGDDDAAIAFRRMLAASVVKESNDDRGGHQSLEQESYDPTTSLLGQIEYKFTPNLQGAMDPQDRDDDNNNKKKSKGQDSRSALEKAVGRKDRGQNLSYQQQIERFPQLKNAPMAVTKQQTGEGEGGGGGGDGSTLMVNFKPLGGLIQHVRCLACGIWGHARGDRECSKSGWDPFAMPSSSSTIGKNSIMNKSVGVVGAAEGPANNVATSNRNQPLNTIGEGDDRERASAYKARIKKRGRHDSDDSSECDRIRSHRDIRDSKRTRDNHYKDDSTDRDSDSDSYSSNEEDDRRRLHRKHKKRHKSSSSSSRKREKRERKETKKNKKARKHRHSRSDDDS